MLVEHLMRTGAGQVSDHYAVGSTIRPAPTDNNHDDGWPERDEGQEAKAYWIRIGIAGKQYHRQQGNDADNKQGQPCPELLILITSDAVRRIATDGASG